MGRGVGSGDELGIESDEEAEGKGLASTRLELGSAVGEGITLTVTDGEGELVGGNG